MITMFFIPIFILSINFCLAGDCSNCKYLCDKQCVGANYDTYNCTTTTCFPGYDCAYDQMLRNIISMN